MKKKTIIATLALTMAIGLGATVYAASGNTPSGSASCQGLGLGRITAMRGYDYITNILKSKFQLSDSDITSAVNSGKTPYDIASEKGLTQDDIKAAMLEERTNAIDAAVNSGTISKEDGEALKARLNTNMANCTGNFGQRQGQGRGQGYGRMMGGQRGCNFAAPNTGVNQ